MVRPKATTLNAANSFSLVTFCTTRGVFRNYVCTYLWYIHIDIYVQFECRVSVVSLGPSHYDFTT